MDTTPHNFALQKAQMIESEVDGQNNMDAITARLLALHPGLEQVPAQPHWSVMVNKINGLNDERTLQRAIAGYRARRDGLPPPPDAAGPRQRRIYDAVKAYVEEEEEKKRAGVVKPLAPAQETVIDAVSEAQMSGIGQTASTFTVPQYTIGPASLRSGERPNMPIKFSNMKFVAKRDVPREWALIDNPAQLFIVMVNADGLVPLYEYGDFVLVEATGAVGVRGVHVLFEETTRSFVLAYASPVRPGVTRVKWHELDDPTVGPSSELNVHGRVLRKIPKEMAAAWIAANGNGRVNTSEVAC